MRRLRRIFFVSLTAVVLHSARARAIYTVAEPTLDPLAQIYARFDDLLKAGALGGTCAVERWDPPPGYEACAVVEEDPEEQSDRMFWEAWTPIVPEGDVPQSFYLRMTGGVGGVSFVTGPIDIADTIELGPFDDGQSIPARSGVAVALTLPGQVVAQADAGISTDLGWNIEAPGLGCMETYWDAATRQARYTWLSPPASPPGTSRTITATPHFAQRNVRKVTFTVPIQE